MWNRARGDRAAWISALACAAPAASIVLGLFYYWFAIADRYAVFLYGHLNATPFDEATSSRYWMAGLVASGVVAVLFAAAFALFRRFNSSQRVPAWGRMWLLAAPLLGAGIPFITLTFNAPTLPGHLAAACAGVALLGLSLALWFASRAAGPASEFAWLGLHGLALVPTLVLVRAAELPGRGLSISPAAAAVVAATAPLAGAAWLGFAACLRFRRGHAPLHPLSILGAGLVLSYLLLPLLHHVAATPPAYRYITAASNFFAWNPGLQLIVFLIAAALAFGTRLLPARVSSPGGTFLA